MKYYLHDFVCTLMSLFLQAISLNWAQSVYGVLDPLVLHEVLWTVFSG